MSFASPHWAHRIGRAAVLALYDELALAPKPGLVSFVDTGSHDDMDASSFMRSLFALRGYFVQCARLGREDCDFATLEQAGRDAEQRMLRATGGVNTHRGAVFSLGLLCASAAHAARGALAVRESLRAQWGAALFERAGRARSGHGHRLAREHGLRSANEEAAHGMPVLFEHAWPALQRARALRLSPRHARLHCLMHAIAVLDDTNLVHRGGLRALAFAQRAARDFIAAGGAARPDAIEHARSLHREFVAQRLSPGGAADVLACACWLERVAEQTRVTPAAHGCEAVA